MVAGGLQRYLREKNVRCASRVSSSLRAVSSSLQATSTPMETTLQSHTPSEAAAGLLQEFLSAVSGEWAGFSFDCTSDGRPVELPASLTPQAFRDWGQQLFGWETLTSSRAEFAGENVSLLKSTVRFQPAAGCDASCPPPQTKDRQLSTFSALNPTIDQSESISTSELDSSALFFSPDGAYVSVAWQEGGEVDIEHCFILPSLQELSSFSSTDGSLPPAFSGVRSGDKVRLRVNQRLRMGRPSDDGDLAVASVTLRGVTVAKERWIGPYVGAGEFEEGGLAVARFEEEGEGGEEEREEKERQWRERLSSRRWQVQEERSSSETQVRQDATWVLPRHGNRIHS